MQSPPPVFPRKHSLIRTLIPPGAQPTEPNHTVSGGGSARSSLVHAEREVMQSPPPVFPRKHSLIRTLIPPGAQPTEPNHTVSGGGSARSSLVHAEREVELLNHCIADVEGFMLRLQQTAEAQSVLQHRARKKSRKKSSRRKSKEQEDDLLTLKACPPSKEEFVDIFQKVKYSLSLLDRLKTEISEPNSEELLHHIFIPLDLMVKTVGGPALAAEVSSPALTGGAVTLLHTHLTEQEKELWTSLGPNWTLPHSQLDEAVSLYIPVFLDGWQPEVFDPEGELWEDPIESQHRQDALIESQEHSRNQEADTSSTNEPDGERLYCCSYDFVARNSSELSVLQGETLEAIESSKRWWKCRNSYDQIGFVPYNILEPLSALNITGQNPAAQRQSMKVPLSPMAGKFFSSSPPGDSPAHNNPRPQSMPPAGDDGDRMMMINDELMQRLRNGRAGSVRPLVIARATETSAPLNYHSPPTEVQSWLSGKGFSQETVQCLGILTGAQLFSLNKEELRSVSPEEGVRVYSQITVQKALLEDVRKSTELEAVMEKQKMKGGSETRE